MAAPPASQVFYPPPVPQKKPPDDASDKHEHNGAWNRCCCCHVIKGMLVIGAFEIIFLIAQLAGTVATYVLVENAGSNFTQPSDEGLVERSIKSTYGSAYSDYNWIYGQSALATLCVGVGSGVIGIAVVTLMLIGVCKSKPRLIIPHMICQILAVLALFGGVALFIYASVTVSTSNACTSQSEACTRILSSFGAFIVVFAFFAGLQIYFLVISIRCFRYLKEKSKRYANNVSPYYAIYQQHQRQYQQQLQQQQYQQLMQQQQQTNSTNGQQQAAANPQGYAAYQQPIYATYANPYGYNYGYRYA